MADDGWRMIPPPYPFPDAWPALAQQQQRGDARAPRWLSPLTPISQYATTPTMATARPPAARMEFRPVPAREDLSTGRLDEPEKEDDEGDNGEDDDSSEYEYGYVLRDEWQQYLRETVLSDSEIETENPTFERPSRRQRPQQKMPQRNKPKNPLPRTEPIVRLPRTPLDLALADARAIEAQRARERHALPLSQDGASWQTVESMETALHAQFEAFCDRYRPTVWPQGASY